MSKRSKHDAEINVTANTDAADAAITATMDRLAALERRAMRFADSAGVSKADARKAVNQTVAQTAAAHRREDAQKLASMKQYERDFKALVKEEDKQARDAQKAEERRYEKKRRLVQSNWDAAGKAQEKALKKQESVQAASDKRMRKSRMRAWDQDWNTKQAHIKATAKAEETLQSKIARTRQQRSDQAWRDAFKFKDDEKREQNARTANRVSGIFGAYEDKQRSRARGRGDILSGAGIVGGGLLAGGLMASTGNPATALTGVGVAAGAGVAGVGKIVSGIGEMLSEGGKDIPIIKMLTSGVGAGLAAAGAVAGASLGARMEILEGGRRRESGELLLDKYGGGGAVRPYSGFMARMLPASWNKASRYTAGGFYGRMAAGFGLSPDEALQMGTAFGGGAGSTGLFGGGVDTLTAHMMRTKGVGPGATGGMLGAMFRAGGGASGRNVVGAAGGLSAFMGGTGLMGNAAAGAAGGFFNNLAAQGLTADPGAYWSSVGGISKAAAGRGHNAGTGLGAMRIHAGASAFGSQGAGGLKGMFGGALQSILTAQALASTGSISGAIGKQEEWAANPKKMLAAARKGGATTDMLRMGLAGNMSQDDISALLDGTGGAYAETENTILVPGLSRTKKRALAQYETAASGEGGDKQYAELVRIGETLKRATASITSGDWAIGILQQLERVAQAVERF